MFERLRQRGFDLAIRNHAAAILQVDFPDVAREIEDVLTALRIPAEELIGSGGGEAASTQRLRQSLTAQGWPKHSFDFTLSVDGVQRRGISHEIDHVRRTPAGTIALEIEWNNKDPFFDRDLENFQRLHAQSAISLGILVTRGASLQSEMLGIIRGCIEKNGFSDETEMVARFGMKERTRRQAEAVRTMTARGQPFADAFARQFVSDKFGMATTHWDKLQERIDRGVGNPCPLLLIGLPTSVVVG